jgi:hypothetical protein
MQIQPFPGTCGSVVDLALRGEISAAEAAEDASYTQTRLRHWNPENAQRADQIALLSINERKRTK